MAAFETHGQTLAALVEVGDKIRNGETPDDFMTVMAVHPRPTYVKLELAAFDHTLAVVRIANTQILHLLDFNGADAPCEDCGVTECKGKGGLCGNTETLEGGYCMFCREEGEGA